MKPAVSIVVPVHNRERTIVRCLTSILHQTFRNFEAVVVDDASTDQTRRYIASVADARIRLSEHDEAAHRPLATTASARPVPIGSPFSTAMMSGCRKLWHPSSPPRNSAPARLDC